jgi:hypothetical protein
VAGVGPWRLGPHRPGARRWSGARSRLARGGRGPSRRPARPRSLGVVRLAAAELAATRRCRRTCRWRWRSTAPSCIAVGTDPVRRPRHRHVVAGAVARGQRSPCRGRRDAGAPCCTRSASRRARLGVAAGLGRGGHAQPCRYPRSGATGTLAKVLALPRRCRPQLAPRPPHRRGAAESTSTGCSWPPPCARRGTTSSGMASASPRAARRRWCASAVLRHGPAIRQFNAVTADTGRAPARAPPDAHHVGLCMAPPWSTTCGRPPIPPTRCSPSTSAPRRPAARRRQELSASPVGPRSRRLRPGGRPGARPRDIGRNAVDRWSAACCRRRPAAAKGVVVSVGPASDRAKA